MSKTVYEIVTQRIVEELEKGIIPWVRPWVMGNRYPVNWKTQKAYNGLNRILLPPGEYATFKQITEAGGKVKKGEKAHLVAFWKWIEVEDKNEKEKNKKKKIPFLRYYSVFEINTQCDGLKSKSNTEEYQHNPLAAAERIVEGYTTKPTIQFAPGRAFYSPALDYISIPSMQDFPELSEYYSTLFHELAHSTGHATRLNRTGVAVDAGKFGSETYSKEELVAELTAAFLATEAGITQSMENRAAYIGGWLKALKNDKTMIVFAASQANKAAEYILGKAEEAEDVEEREEAA